MGEIKAVCISDRKGIAKRTVACGRFLPEYGIEGDAHAGAWHRQVSLLGYEKIEAFRARGAQVAFGAFGENLVADGIDFAKLPVGTLLRANDVLLEVTQIGKECHAHCAIYKMMGDCIMPREGVFARVLEGGTVRVGDKIEIEARAGHFPWQTAVITLSDKGAAHEREDESGPVIAGRLKAGGYQVTEEILLPDDAESLKKHLVRLCDQRQLDLILTTGGTGFSPRDITPEATLSVADRQAPGIAEAIRNASMKITPRAMLSRGVAAIRGKTLIINLPGSPKACAECMDVFMETIPHGLELLRGEGGDCAQTAR
ncbi:MAG: MOSC domain-containing protein [Clostridiales bacterium]|nr:MOSC domain-containing protein [Clostridiales bacterium]